MIAYITGAYVRHYGDNGQTTAYVEWVDGRGQRGRTEGPATLSTHQPIGTHMTALFERAKREGVEPYFDMWGDIYTMKDKLREEVAATGDC